jgi:hypothetical protein
MSRQTGARARCVAVADTLVPNYRNGSRAYSCGGHVAKMWQAAYDGAAAVLADPLPADVRRLVIAARVVAWEDQDEAAMQELRVASELFADRVVWEDQPDFDLAPTAPQVEGLTSESEAERIGLTVANIVERHLISPAMVWGLPELPESWMTELRSVLVAALEGELGKGSSADKDAIIAKLQKRSATELDAVLRLSLLLRDAIDAIRDLLPVLGNGYHDAYRKGAKVLRAFEAEPLPAFPVEGLTSGEGKTPREILEAMQQDRSTEAGRAAFRMLKRFDGAFFAPYTEREDWITIFAAASPKATATASVREVLYLNREVIARVLFSQRQTPHDFDDAADADPESDAGTLYSIVWDDADAVVASLTDGGTAATIGGKRA